MLTEKLNETYDKLLFNNENSSTNENIRSSKHLFVKKDFYHIIILQVKNFVRYEGVVQKRSVICRLVDNL